MKKRLMAILLSLVMVLSLVPAIAFANDDTDPYVEDPFGDPVEHTAQHSVVHHVAVASTCKDQGNIEYWYCEDCVAYFSDAACTTEINESSILLPLSTTHQTTLQNAKSASCTEAGYTGDEVCTVCGKTITTGSVINKTSHTLTNHPAVSPTEEADGNTEYWECTSCHKYFSDANGETEIAENSWVIPKITQPSSTTAYSNEHENDPSGDDVFGEDHPDTHNVTAYPAVAATCTTAGNSAYWYCEDCNKYFSDAECTTEIQENSWVIPASHKLTKHNAVSATCTTAGNTEYWECTSCHKYFSDAQGKTEIAENSWVIPASHTMVYHQAAQSDCKTHGNNAYYECTVCHKYFTDANGANEVEANSWVLPLAEHTALPMVVENKVSETCTENGGYDEVVYCSVCNEVISSNHVVVLAPGHNMTATAAIDATCTEAGNTAYWYCDACQKFFSDSEGKTEIAENSWVIKALGHKLTEFKAKAATCTEAGNKAYWYCETCNKYFSDAEGKTEIAKDSWVIKALGHNFVQTDYKAATTEKTGLITYTCKNCGAKKTTVLAKLDEGKPLSPASAPSVAQAEKGIFSSKTDEAPAGSLFNLLKLKAGKVTKNSIKLKWSKVKGATGYIVYGSRCGSNYKKVKTLKGGSKVTLNLKKLKKGKYYKYFVVAIAKYKGTTKVIASSKTVHIATKGGKVGNYKSVKLKNVKKNKVSIKKGKTFKIKAKSIVQSKKLKVKKHRTFRYESTNSKVAKVNQKGKITAKKKGTCFVYVYDQSGNCQKIKVTVK